MENFLSHHYAIKQVSPEIRERVVEQMLKLLDPTKSLLYASDVKRIKPLLQQAFTNSQAGNCALLKPIHELLLARTLENEFLAKKILQTDFTLDENTELVIDAEKRSYVRTIDEKQALLKKFLQFRIENDVLSGIPLPEAKKQQIHRYEMQTHSINQRYPEKLIEMVAEAFAQALDPHTDYLSPDDFEDVKMNMRLSLEGIGAFLSNENGFTVIEELIPGGSAERSGLLKPKDKIIAVAQKDGHPVNVIDMDLREVVKMIRGKKGTPVTLTILRQGEQTQRFQITLIRNKVHIKNQEAKIRYETRTVRGKTYRFGIIDLPSFYGDEREKKSSYEDVKKLLLDAQRHHVDGLVLDLSRNGGGLVEEAVQITGLFLGPASVVAMKDHQGKLTFYINGTPSETRPYKSARIISYPLDDINLVYRGPLVVLTSRFSASASEIVAGVLKEYRRAVIIGTDHTFGKGSVQTLTPLPRDMGGVKVTTAMYFLPGGDSTQKTGVVADIQLPSFYSLEEIGEDRLDYTLPSQRINPFFDIAQNTMSFWKPLEEPTVSKLSLLSRQRVAKDDKFAEIIKKNRDAARKKGVICLADLRKEMGKKGGLKNETPSETQKRIREQYAPFINESVNVLLDMVLMNSV